jgi:transcriptional regulator with XRE-family HTH domain
VARLESGRRDVTLSTLHKAAEALGAELVISLKPRHTT